MKRMRPYIKKDVFTVQFYGVHASRGKRVEFEHFFQSDNLVESITHSMKFPLALSTSFAVDLRRIKVDPCAMCPKEVIRQHSPQAA